MRRALAARTELVRGSPHLGGSGIHANSSTPIYKIARLNMFQSASRPHKSVNHVRNLPVLDHYLAAITLKSILVPRSATFSFFLYQIRLASSSPVRKQYVLEVFRYNYPNSTNSAFMQPTPDSLVNRSQKIILGFTALLVPCRRR